MTAKENSIFQTMDAKIGSSQNTDCIKQRDLIAHELIDNAEKIPAGITIFSCSYDSAHDPHHWIEIHKKNGDVLVWDRTRQKIKDNNFSKIEDASKIWRHYKNPSSKLQIIPIVFE